MYIKSDIGLIHDHEVGQVELFVGTEKHPGSVLASVAVEAQEVDPDTAEPVSYRIIVTLGSRPNQPILDDRIRRDELVG